MEECCDEAFHRPPARRGGDLFLVWEGDTLVVTSNGFRDDLWIDWNGSMITEAAKVRERMRRPDFGHLEVEVTIDDLKAYTEPRCE